MNTLTKLSAVALAALTITAGTFAAPTQAHAFPKFGKGAGLGIAAAIIGTTVGAIVASSANTGPRCKMVERFDRYGNFRGEAEVCR
jgi:hypothetical protein